jgi:hypothetical protein
MAKEEKKLAKQFEKVYGYNPQNGRKRVFQRAIENERNGRERGDLFFLDN